MFCELSMQAAIFNKYGGPEVIEINQNAPLPTLNAGQVLVACYAASINPVDSFFRSGYLQKMLPVTLPATCAGDFSGEVKETGSEVSNFKVGDKVYGMAPAFFGGSGSTAEFVSASAAATAIKPTSVNFSAAASLPLAGVSAVQALENAVQPNTGQKVLIHGGAGGIGSIAIQYAKHLGCYVATTVRSSQEEFVDRLGADKIIDFEAQQFENSLKDYDAVLDTVGGDVYKRSFSILKKDGIVVSMIQNVPDQELMSRYHARSIYITAQVSTASLSRLAELVDTNIIKPQIDKEFPLEKTSEAYNYFEKEHPKGKVVIKIMHGVA
jgi:alcohol dehydrogenase